MAGTRTGGAVEQDAMKSSPEPIRVLIVDDHPVVRFGLVAIIESQRDMAVAGEAGTGADAISMYRRERPHVGLIDLRLPDMGGVEVIRTIAGEYPRSRLIVLTTYDGDEDIYRALEAGAQGYLIKGMSHQVLLDAIRRVHAGLRYVPQPVMQHLAERAPNSELTSREREVLTLIVRGKSNKEIAALLGITEGTVKCHVNVILSRLGVSDRTQAAVAALQRGIVHL